MKVLSFDISSTTIGYCVLEVNEYKITYVQANYLKPIKTGTIIERLANTREKIKEIIKQVKPDEIVIEDIIQFMAGGSTAKTIITLTSFNRMIGLLAYDYLNRPPQMLSVMSIRHCIKRQANLGGLPKKEDLPRLLEKLLDIEFSWVYGKKGAIKIESYDISDAICCGYCYIVSKVLNDNSKTRKNTNNKPRKTDK